MSRRRPNLPLPARKHHVVLDVVCAPCERSGREQLMMARVYRYLHPGAAPQTLVELSPTYPDLFVEPWKHGHDDQHTPRWTKSPDDTETIVLDCGYGGHRRLVRIERFDRALRELTPGPSGSKKTRVAL